MTWRLLQKLILAPCLQHMQGVRNNQLIMLQLQWQREAMQRNLQAQSLRTAKQIGDLDDQTSAPGKTPSSIGKKSPVRQRNALQQSYGKGDDSDTDDDDGDDDVLGENVSQAMKSLSQKQETGLLDDDDDNDDFQGMFF